MIYRNEAGEIKLDCNFYLSDKALDTYMFYNQEKFAGICTTFDIFDDICNYIELKHNQKLRRVLTPFTFNFSIESNKKVLLAFSGGLDSTYQAIILKELGYEVILFHVKNMNYYTNGKEFQVVQEFSNKFSFPLIIPEFKQNTRGQYKKFWKENSFKNTLLYSMMIDYCINNNISNISSGDDLRLDIKDTVVGTNVADAKQLTESFFSKIPVNFIPIKEDQHKGIRLKKLIDTNAFDLFYSCVNPGRFNQLNHNKIQDKYRVKLEKWNCGVCRKCAYHSLLRYYYLQENLPEDFINFCWQKIANGADYEFFKSSLSLETRIQNLFDY